MRRCSSIQAASVILLSVSMSPVFAAVHHVKSDAGGAGDGTRWADAFTNPQDALVAAAPGDEIWVAAGTYTPADPGGDRNVSFDLRSNVALYGGFAGTETDRDQRDPEANHTILSGDLNGDDAALDDADPTSILTEPTRADNSYHVVTAIAVDETAVLDGFVITGGHANGAAIDVTDVGGGVFCSGASPTLRRVTFSGNTAEIGGGMEITDASTLTLTDCTFTSNWARLGGGLESFLDNTVTLVRCTFEDNVAFGPKFINVGNLGGGAVLATDGGTLVIDDCTFRDNKAGIGDPVSADGTDGGAVRIRGLDTVTIEECRFEANTATEGGAALFSEDCEIILRHTLFTENSTFFAAIQLINCTGALSDCAIVRNRAASIVGLWLRNNSDVTIDRCVFRENIGNGGAGGALQTSPGSDPQVLRCVFEANQARLGGGAHIKGGAPTFIDCTFQKNVAHNVGGAIFSTGSETYINCVFQGNRAGDKGGAFANFFGAPAIVNCTLHANVANNDGGGIWNGSNAQTSVWNSILWGNRTSVRRAEEAQVFVESGNVDVGFSCIEGLNDLAGNGNIGLDPLFVRPNAPGEDGSLATADDVSGDLHLLPKSPCVDAGDNSALPLDTHDLDSDADDQEPIPFDLDENPRIGNSIVDMGAFEFAEPSVPGDSDGDGDVDLADFLSFQACFQGPTDEPVLTSCVAFDFDGDNDVDLADLIVLQAAFTEPK